MSFVHSDLHSSRQLCQIKIKQTWLAASSVWLKSDQTDFANSPQIAKHDKNQLNETLGLIQKSIF